MSRTIDAVRVVPLLATRDPESLLTFFSQTLDLEAHWKHEDGDGRLVHAEVLWGSDRISLTKGEPRRCSLGLEVEDEATVERLFERALSRFSTRRDGFNPFESRLQFYDPRRWR